MASQPLTRVNRLHALQASIFLNSTYEAHYSFQKFTSFCIFNFKILQCCCCYKLKNIYIYIYFFFILYWSIAGYREGNGTPLRYSCLENPMDGGAWWAAVHGVAGSRAQLSDFTVTFHFHLLEEEMATHSSVLAWRIPGTGEPGGLPCMGSHRVGHD